MDSILYQLFSGEYDTTPERNKTQQKLYDQIFAEVSKIEAVFGNEFLDRLLDLEGELEYSRSFQYYRSGFRLGVQLTLEALRA